MAPETGTKLIPCEENPYYRLATVHGVQKNLFSSPFIAFLNSQNRVIWNRYFAQGLDDSQKAKLKNQGVPSNEIDTPLTVAEQEAIRKRLDGLEEPNYTKEIEFCKVQFDSLLPMAEMFSKCSFDC